MKSLFLAVLLLAQGPSALQSGVVAGRVLDVNGRPTPGIRVAVMEAPTTTGQSDSPTLLSIGETDSAGAYRLENVPPDRYYILAGPAMAKSYLLAAGKVGSSPVLSSFGPRMELTNELLRKGERDAVQAYLEECLAFWTSTRGQDLLKTWIDSLKRGETPNLANSGR